MARSLSETKPPGIGSDGGSIEQLVGSEGRSVERAHMLSTAKARAGIAAIPLQREVPAACETCEAA